MEDDHVHVITMQSRDAAGDGRTGAQPVFDDTDPSAYFDPANPMGSVKVESK